MTASALNAARRREHPMGQKVVTTETSDNSDVSVTVVRAFYETLLRGNVETISTS
jgi:hypothetical protein